MSNERLHGWEDAEHNRYTVDDRINDFFYNKREVDAMLGAIDPDNPNLGGGGFVTLEVYADDQAALELEQQAQDTKIDANTAKNVSQDSNIQANSNDITVLKGKVNVLENNQHELYDDTAIWAAHDQLEADVTNHFNNHGGSYDDTAIWEAVNNNSQGVQDNADAIANLDGGGGAYDDEEVRGLIQDNADAIADLEYLNQLGTFQTSTTSTANGFVKVTGTDGGSSVQNVTQLQFASLDQGGLQTVNEVYVGAIITGYMPVNNDTKYVRFDYLVTDIPNLRTYTVEQLTSQGINKAVDVLWRVHPNTEGAGGGPAYDDTAIRADVDTNTSKNEQQDGRLDALESAPGYDDSALDARVTATETTNATQDSRLDALEADTGYDDTQLAARVSATETKNSEQDARIDALEASPGYDDTEVRGLIQDNTDALNTKWGIWTGTQAEYDALGTYNDDTLYVVV